MSIFSNSLFGDFERDLLDAISNDDVQMFNDLISNKKIDPKEILMSKIPSVIPPNYDQNIADKRIIEVICYFAPHNIFFSGLIQGYIQNKSQYISESNSLLESAIKGRDPDVINAILATHSTDIPEKDVDNLVEVLVKEGYYEILERIEDSSAQEKIKENSKSFLRFAITSEDIDTFKYIYDKYESADFNYKDNMNILHYAAMTLNIDFFINVVSILMQDEERIGQEKIQELFNQGEAINGDNFLMYCILNSKNSPEEFVTAFLRDLEFNITYIVNKDGNRILHYACMKGYLNIFEQALHILEADIDNVNFGSEEDKNNFYCVKNNDGDTPASLALKNGHTEIIQFMIQDNQENDKHGLFQTNKQYENLLHIIAKNSNSSNKKEFFEIFIKLLEIDGYDIKLQEYDSSGLTPLAWAAISGNLEILQLIESTHPGLLFNDVTQYTDRRLIHWAVIEGHDEIVNFLFECTEFKNYPDIISAEPPYSPLHFAIIGGNARMMLLLLEHGANPNKVEGNYKIKAPITYIENPHMKMLLDKYYSSKN